MATAERSVQAEERKVVKTEIVTKNVFSVVLSEEEAAVFLQISNYVGGHPNKRKLNGPTGPFDGNYDRNTAAPRGHIANIASALRAAGAKESNHSLSNKAYIYFEDVYTD